MIRNIKVLVVGVLKGWDKLVNLVLDEGVERIEGTFSLVNVNLKRRQIKKSRSCHVSRNICHSCCSFGWHGANC
jgi:small nuclear ribonucleoprotein (snRNP)-like protein